MDFKEAENYLLSLGNEVLAMKLGLVNITTLLHALGDPHKDYLKIQIVGTNGKGSTCAFLQSIFDEANIKNGMTTSPHLVSITERIKINGVEVSETEFAALATDVRNTSEQLVFEGKLESVPTYFEQVTAMALLAFSKNNVEIAILETGLGGRFDATTAAEAEIIGFTSIDLDHQNILGDTIEEIAAEKAGAINRECRVVIGDQNRTVLKIISARCSKFGIEPIFATKDILTKTEMVDYDLIKSSTFHTSHGTYTKVRLGLEGEHQNKNASVALAIAESLANVKTGITQSTIVSGLEKARHSGRMEWLEGFLFDGAHNVSGARALVDNIKKEGDYKIAILFGAMNDKNVEAILAVLAEVADSFVFTQASNERSFSPGELKRSLPVNFPGTVYLEDDLTEAIEFTRNKFERRMILVTGSLYLVGEVQKILLRNV